MRVVLINSVCGVGSTGRICTDIAEMLIKQGHECIVAYGRGNAPEKFKNISRKIGGGFSPYINAGLARVLDNEGLNAKKQTEEFVKWLEEYNPDVIHLHNLHGYYINYEILFDYLKRADKRVIWTLHDCWAFTGHCSHYTFVKCDKWKTGCENCMQKGEYPKSSLCDGSKSNYAKKKNAFLGVKNLTIVTPSEWLKREVEKSFLGGYSVKVINNGIDLGRFSKCEVPAKYKSDKKIILGAASTWDERKGLYDFNKLAGMISDEYKIMLVGVKKEQMKELDSRIVALERTDTVEELAQLYSSAYVFFNPTYEDTYSNVNLEAQACGTPVIAHRIGGSYEMVPTENVIEAGDLQAAAALLGKKLEVKPVTQSRERMAEEYLGCYE